MPKQPVHKEDNQTGVITRTEAKTKKPSLYKVLLLNDDDTPMELVLHVLQRLFTYGRAEPSLSSPS